MSDLGRRDLSATASVWLDRGESITVLSGTALVFCVDSLDRRLPVATVGAGEVVFGCGAGASGERMLVTGLPGTSVVVASLGSAPDPVDVGRWAAHLAPTATGGVVADHVATIGGAEEQVPAGHSASPGIDGLPGEGGAPELGWLSIRAGRALWCGRSGVPVDPSTGPVAMPTGTWLLAEADCVMASGPAPMDVRGWIDGLDLLGRLALQSSTAEQNDLDRARVARLSTERAAATERAAGAVVALATTLPQARRSGMAEIGHLDRELAVALDVAQARGLRADADALERARQHVLAGRDAVHAAAQACHATARRISLQPGWLRAPSAPLLTHTRSGDPVALTHDGATWRMTDASGSHRRVDESVAAELSADAVEFIPVLAPVPSRVRDLLRIASGGSRRTFIVIAVTTALIGLLSFVSPLVLGRLAGSVLTDTPDPLLLPVTSLVLILLATTLWQLGRGRAMLRLRATFTVTAAAAVWDRVMRLRLGWFADRGIGQLMTQATAVNTAAASLPDLVLTRLLDAVIVLGSVVAVATTTPALVVSVVVLALLQILVGVLLVRGGARRTTARIQASAASSGMLIRTLQAVDRLAVFAAQDRAFSRWASVHAQLTRTDWSLRRMTLTQSLVTAAWPIIGLILIVGASASSGATFGQFVTAQTAAAAITASLAAASLAGSTVFNAVSTIAAAAPILAAVPEGHGSGRDPGIVHGGLEVRSLSFAYPNVDRRVLEDVSFFVQAGEQVAVVGASGCGKTTLMRLLLGLETPGSGVIAVDGQDISTLDQPALRRQVGCVLQSSTLLPGKIRDNIDMGRALTSEQIWAALEAASIADDVRALKMGLETPVSDTGGLSGGQRQRLLIARALAGRPRLLVLDEATSALDNVTQAAVVGSLERLRITRIVVAHRLSTIRHADRIVVIDSGTVAQLGDFETLMAREGIFRRLAERQLTGSEFG